MTATIDPTPFIELRLWHETFARLQKHRLAMQNSMTQGSFLPDVAEPMMEVLHEREKMTARAMRASFRRAAPHLNVWARETVGVGQHSIARLVGVIGHPCVAFPRRWDFDARTLVDLEPHRRSISQLWAYCGVGYSGRRRRRGESKEVNAQAGHPQAKLLAFLLADSAIRFTGGRYSRPSSAQPVDYATDESGFFTEQAEDGETGEAELIRPRRSSYRDVYDRGRAKYEDRDWNPSHQHRSAMRLVAKAIIKDVWIVADAAMAKGSAVA